MSMPPFELIASRYAGKSRDDLWIEWNALTGMLLAGGHDRERMVERVETCPMDDDTVSYLRTVMDSFGVAP